MDFERFALRLNQPRARADTRNVAADVYSAQAELAQGRERLDRVAKSITVRSDYVLNVLGPSGNASALAELARTSRSAAVQLRRVGETQQELARALVSRTSAATAQRLSWQAVDWRADRPDMPMLARSAKTGDPHSASVEARRQMQLLPELREFALAEPVGGVTGTSKVIEYLAQAPGRLAELQQAFRRREEELVAEHGELSPEHARRLLLGSEWHQSRDRALLS
jgi:hypothetical protein